MQFVIQVNPPPNLTPFEIQGMLERLLNNGEILAKEAANTGNQYAQQILQLNPKVIQ